MIRYANPREVTDQSERPMCQSDTCCITLRHILPLVTSYSLSDGISILISTDGKLPPEPRYSAIVLAFLPYGVGPASGSAGNTGVSAGFPGS